MADVRASRQPIGDRDEERNYLVLIEAPPPAPLSVAFATAPDGSRFFPAFTDRAAMLRFQPQGGETASAPLAALQEMAKAAGMPVVIDPDSAEARRV